MVVSTETVLKLFRESFEEEYGFATIYGDIDQEQVLYEGAVRILSSGWVELPDGRLISPGAIHHMDVEQR